MYIQNIYSRYFSNIALHFEMAHHEGQVGRPSVHSITPLFFLDWNRSRLWNRGAFGLQTGAGGL